MGADAAVGLAVAVYWLPTFVALFLARQAGRLAFLALMAWVWLLVAVGARDAACHTLDRAMQRLDARARELRDRRG